MTNEQREEMKDLFYRTQGIINAIEEDAKKLRDIVASCHRKLYETDKKVTYEHE